MIDFVKKPINFVKTSRNNFREGSKNYLEAVREGGISFSLGVTALATAVPLGCYSIENHSQVDGVLSGALAFGLGYVGYNSLLKE
ncbi:hypothetical protein KBC85_03875 [Candidatus Saccharibacteria bacterium]|nr:hypothetical protein [Candidatus Saccharibacteria bacterium]